MGDELRGENHSDYKPRINKEEIVNEIEKCRISGTEKGGNCLKPYEPYRITDKTNIPKPIPIVTINGESITTEGNITTISGASKSGKSAFTGILIAGAISPNGVYDGIPEVIVQPNKNKKAVIHIDTEQARHKHQQNLISILHRCKMQTCPDYYLSYNLRQLDISEYKVITKGICQAAFEKFGGIHLITIDGLADYISDVNDPIQSNAIIKFFEEIAMQFKTPIITIVHTNPGSNKERGHLGSQCQRKSESVLIVTTKNDISTIEPKLLRNAGKGNIPLLQFIYDKEKGYHVGCGIKGREEADKDAKRIELVQQICNEVFSGQKSYDYQQSIDSIMKHTKKQKRTAKDYFADMNAHEMITQGDDKNWRKAI